MTLILVKSNLRRINGLRGSFIARRSVFLIIHVTRLTDDHVSARGALVPSLGPCDKRRGA